MKQRFSKLIIGTALIGLAVSCGKYEEGPGLSLRTKTGRLVGTWDYKEYVSKEGVTEADNGGATFTIEKDGTYKATSGSSSLTGKWSLNSEKTELTSTFSATIFGVTTETKNTSTIIRLTNKELWTKDSDGDIIKSEKI